jgi:hypothetical protein
VAKQGSGSIGVFVCLVVNSGSYRLRVGEEFREVVVLKKLSKSDGSVL